MQPFEQGALDSLCGIYSIVNANRVINKISREESEKLFQEIIHFLSRGQLLEDMLIKGMFLKDLTKILDDDWRQLKNLIVLPHLLMLPIIYLLKK